MTQIQQGDVDLFQTNDDGDITVEGGTVTMGGGLGTSVYISLFGGNMDDDGSEDNTRKWWGNINELATARKITSETQALLETSPAITANLNRIKSAAERDLAWLVAEGVASSVEISVGMPGVNRVGIVARITAEGIESEFKYIENWKTKK